MKESFQPLGLSLSDRVLAELLDGGQAFRWHRQPDGSWLGGWGRHLVEVRRRDGDDVSWRARTPATTAADVAAYFAQGLNAERLDRLPWRSDPALEEAMAAFPGLRLLRQPLAETLLGFLCSSTKQIVQIKDMMRLLADQFGEPLAPGWNCLPTWSELGRVPETALLQCKLGYRARYIAGTALRLRHTPDWEERVTEAPYPEAREFLCTLPGVGVKVADCVLLFGAGKLEAFPVDTWIIKVMQETYGLDGWKPEQIAHFGRIHFGASAGLAQQFLFASARARSPRGPAAHLTPVRGAD